MTFFLLCVGMLALTSKKDHAFPSLVLSVFAGIAVLLILNAINVSGHYLWDTNFGFTLLLLSIGAFLYVRRKAKRDSGSSGLTSEGSILRSRLTLTQLSPFLVAGFILWLGAEVLIWHAFSTSFALPLHDPVAAPTLAKLIFESGRIPETLAPHSTKPFLYPPGLPLFLSFFYFPEVPTVIMLAMKTISIASLALGPLAFAYALNGQFTDKLKQSESLLLSFCFFAGFFLLERTLILAPVFAGKNAQILAGAGLATWIGFAFSAPHTWKTRVFLVLSAAGIIMCHYSAMYMGVAWIISIVILEPEKLVRTVADMKKRRPIDWGKEAKTLQAGGLFGIGTLLVLPHLLSVKEKGLSVGAPKETAPVEPLLSHALSFLKENSKFLEIFNYYEWQKWTLLWGTFTLGICAFVVMLLTKTLLKKGLGNWQVSFDTSRLILCSVTAVVIAAFFGTGRIPGVRLDMNFARWFVFFFVACAISLGLFLIFQSLLILFRSGAQMGFLRMLPWGGGVAALLTLLFLHPSYQVLQQKVWEGRIMNSEWRNFVREMKLIELEAKECRVFTHNNVYRGFHNPNYRLLNYIPLVSSCLVINGTWTFFDPELKLADDEAPLHWLDNNISAGDFPIHFIGAQYFVEIWASQLRSKYQVSCGDRLNFVEVCRIVGRLAQK